MPKTKLTAVQCDWLIGLVEKDIAQNEAWLISNTEYLPRLFQLRIDNMQDVKQTLEYMQKSIARAACTKSSVPR